MIKYLLVKPSGRRFLPSACVIIAVIAATGISTLLVRHNKQKVSRANAPAAMVKGHEPPTPTLRIERIVQYGHIVEIDASVEPGTTVMVNGERAAVIWEDGEIKHFVGPLPDGVSEIAVSVQNDEGGIATQQLSVSLP